MQWRHAIEVVSKKGEVVSYLETPKNVMIMVVSKKGEVVSYLETPKNAMAT